MNFRTPSTKVLVPLVVVWCLARFAPAQTPACYPVEGDHIQAKDLAVVLPAFQAAPPDTVLASSPQPGSQRMFRTPELASLAQRFGVALENPQEICFARAMEALAPSKVLEAMRASLGMPDAKIEITEMALVPVPKGRLDFPRGRLVAPPEAEPRVPVLWRGDVIYGDDHRFPVWARVRITAMCTRVIAAEALRAGQKVAQAQLRTESAICFPGESKLVSRLEQAVGRVPLRPIAAGNPLRVDWLVKPNDIDRGELVEVLVRCGAARLVFTGKAVSAGHTGDLIAIRNPSSNKVFQARVEGKGKAVILTDSLVQ
jgi:flagella basal body P-ring formation protein FlgA